QADFLVLTYTPKADLFSDPPPGGLAALARLRDDLSAHEHVVSVISILDVPLLESPPIPLKELTADLPTLASPAVDRELARIEFRDSPLYRNLLVSEDLKTTALLIYFADDQLYRDLLARRNDLRQKKASASLTAPQHAELKRVTEQFRQYRAVMRRQRHQDITAIRNIMEKYRPNADLFLGGVGMIADDMITFIKGDLKVFGIGVLLFLIITLGVIFRSLRWMCIPLLCCLVSVVCMVGLLGWLGWDVTVISSNFISLQLIITLAMTIHLMVRYRELALQQPQAGRHELILATILAMVRPCVYSGLTTMAGFASLILCDIRPVIDFGYIMVVGVAISIIVPFLILPTMLVLLPRDKPRPAGKAKWSLTPALGRFTVAHGPLIVVGSAALLTLNAVGICNLQVENCFINYFKSSTEIHQGMKVLDQQLGGTTPLDVVIDFEPAAGGSEAALSNDAAGTDDVFDQFDPAAGGDAAAQQTKDKYWFTPEKISRIAAVHDYLDGLPETGKVLSVLTLVRMAERLNGGKPLDGVELALLFDKMPQRLKEMLVSPYVSVEHNQVRITVRIRDSDPSLKRNEFLSRIRVGLAGGELGYRSDQIHLSGMLVLYNNMLQSLYSSQIVTIGFASLFLMGTFVVLFRSLRTATIAIFPNVLAVSCVLGMMGWLGIPLDMMTITIAAIGVGLADDDTIHYIHRFKHEVAATGSYRTALHRSHDSIGHAIYYTTVTLVIGFSILSMSNFIPTIYFGLLTVLAITVALLASLTLLPQLLVLIKPFGKEVSAQGGPAADQARQDGIGNSNETRQG
ncbi:MAG TPA: MMPL family transporter, partial [Sedimentisphaerales bacterium]|nr:MMPL family transporter [Sedimentisphaerales bacterium]